MLTPRNPYEKIYLAGKCLWIGLLMNDIKKNDLEKTLSLKIQEIESLKAQNGRLIERLQEEIDKSSTNLIQKEIIHKEIIQIHLTMREFFQQGQLKNAALEKIYNKINEFELKIQEQQKNSASTYGKYVAEAITLEMEQFNLGMLKVQGRETNIEKSLLEMNQQIQEQGHLIKQILRQNLNSNSNSQSAKISKPSDDSVNSNQLSNEIDMKKISYELKNELSNKEDLNLILQMISEKND